MESFSNERPLLGEIKAGDEVIILRSRLRGAEREPVTAHVVKASRVWVELSGNGTSWRMRRDAQDEGNEDYPSSNNRFVTPEQHAWEQKLQKANAVLKAAGITIGYRSPLKAPAARVWLAELTTRQVQGLEAKCPACGVTGGMPHDCETAGRIS